MGGRPLVSVCIPTFNAEPWIRATVQSVLDQTHEPLELVISDGGSSDATQAILAGYKDSRMRVELSPQRLPVIENWNRSFVLATGDLREVSPPRRHLGAELHRGDAQARARGSPMGSCSGGEKFARGRCGRRRPCLGREVRRIFTRALTRSNPSTTGTRCSVRCLPAISRKTGSASLPRLWSPEGACKSGPLQSSDATGHGSRSLVPRYPRFSCRLHRPRAVEIPSPP